MRFRKVTIYIKSGAAELLTARLEGIGITGFEIHDSADFKEFIANKNLNWDYIDDDLLEQKNTPDYVTSYITDDAQGEAVWRELKSLITALGEDRETFGDLRTETSFVNEEDWENSWKEFFKPFPLGEKLMIKPTWEEIQEKNDKIILEIDPASAFGTGQHSTTKLCAELLEKYLAEGDNLLDLGCGSGILSIAGLLLGAGYTVLTDISENAVKVSRENLAQNGFTEARYAAYAGNVITDGALRENIKSAHGKFGLITANIVADVIIPLTPYFKEFLRAGGLVIISGIISGRLPDIKEVLEGNGIGIIETREDEDWCALIGRTENAERFK